ncbi:Hsp20/alpha crystallin family protein [Acidihalobacter ferrooxydans]|uniref:Heat-shock protein Hsp20 n=1 Tax=Acidihalobacter ferrooxydans TaxID=1765967 RepID=A0A1P8UJ40_9GAMM|nr:Hsp20/alpha crystallin family protein [Acidihalobacter ferrooxydans]APZ43824.1 heat-shock protein Hsp20 [Acidihalobacter ferrooxydans]
MAYLATSDLFDQFERMRREMDALFSDWSGPRGIRAVAAGTYPAINIGATPKQVDVYVFAAGLDPKTLDVSLEQNLLTVAGERASALPEGAQIYRRERFDGKFKRVITVPEDVDPDRVNAAYRDGVLHITIARKEELQPRRIEVQ